MTNATARFHFFDKLQQRRIFGQAPIRNRLVDARFDAGHEAGGQDARMGTHVAEEPAIRPKLAALP